ncbi:MMPL family transporter [Streptomyces sp. JJ38]|uniref:MMPL family transporter n=1 Tax=Streptomyces sp. JJ38 TaxID=2738128 RepID=UPI001C5808DF|nr:MMPL family transporter [Streptomyces sp. JJ38]MBW1595810.1 MMPL family transporter [Streptomyces sp. JJ38]
MAAPSGGPGGPPSNAAGRGAPSSGAPSSGRGALLYRLGRWCARHWVTVLLAWVVALAGAHTAAAVWGGDYSDDFTLSDSSAQRGADVLSEHAPQLSGTSAPVVLHDEDGLSRYTRQTADTATALGKLPHVTSVTNPFADSGRDPSAVSKDGRTAYLTVRFDTNPQTLGQDYIDEVDAAVQPLRSAGVQVEYGAGLGELARPAPADTMSEGIGYGVAVVLLLLTFGSVVAAAVPLLSALAAVVVGVAVLGLVAAQVTFASVSPTLATMIGIGVGIDYALFLITRHRQLLLDGGEAADSAGRAVASAGHAVLVSGSTVIVALGGLYASGLTFIGRLGMAAAITVLTALLGALTLAPALLGMAGRGIDRLHVRTPVAETTPAASGAAAGGTWHRWAGFVRRHPWPVLGAGVVVLLILAIPLLSLRLGHIDDGADPASFTDRRAYDLISSGFGVGTNGQLTVVVDQAGVPEDQRDALASSLGDALKNLPGATGATPPQAVGDGDVLLSTVTPAQAPQDAATTDLVHRLADDTLPEVTRGTEASGYVTGVTAAQVDFRDVIAGRLPVIIAVVVGLAFLIILTVFRGVLVAVKAAVLNLLSIAAAYGVLVAVFQWGWGGPALGVNGTVPIESYVPMMMFAIVFGLSMDYEVFLLSRVHAAWLRTGDSHASVAHALEVTARVISCAALIMVSVFGAFVLSDVIVVKMLGLGLAVSVLVDATVVRLLLVPAALTLLGRAAWWMPRALDRLLPRVRAEGAGEAARGA